MSNSKTRIMFREAADFEELSRIGAEVMLDCVKQKPDSMFCLASGTSPIRAYDIFVERVQKEHINVEKLRLLKLDEWWGVPGTDPSTCEYYIRNRLIKSLNIPANNYISFDSNASDPKAECERVDKVLQEQGPIDLCILGMGKNGHLGLNEPGAFFTPYAHVAELQAKTKTHYLLSETSTEINYGMTIGMADIIASRKILFLAAGDGKNETYAQFLKAQVSSELPATALWLHSNTVCVFEKRLANTDKA